MNQPPVRRRQAERRREAERRILVAAAELIGEIGPTRTTLTDIGERAGYSRSLTAHHFGSKQALLSRIIETVTDEFHEDLKQEDAASAVDGILDVVDSYIDALAGPDPLIRARVALWADSAASGSADERRAATEADERFRQEIARRVQSGIDSGEIDSTIEIPAFVTVLIGLLRGAALLHSLDERFDTGAVRREAAHMISLRLRR